MLLKILLIIAKICLGFMIKKQCSVMLGPSYLLLRLCSTTSLYFVITENTTWLFSAVKTSILNLI